MLPTRQAFLWSLLLIVLTRDPERVCASEPVYHDYCIIGAGPGGLQMAYYLQKAGRDYIVFERSEKAGSFFELYPRHRTLLSINKRYTGRANKEYNLRHDWHTLLSDDEHLFFRHYSKDLYPNADDLVRYLRDFHSRHNLSVQFNTTIRNIRSPRPLGERSEAKEKMTETKKTKKKSGKKKKLVDEEKKEQSAVARPEENIKFEKDKKYPDGEGGFIWVEHDTIIHKSKDGGTSRTSYIPDVETEKDQDKDTSKDKDSPKDKDSKDTSKDKDTPKDKKTGKANAGKLSMADPPPEGVHAMEDQLGTRYHCKVLVLATGMWVPFSFDYTRTPLVYGYENVSTNPQDFVNKRVLILGRGNSAMEVAKAIYGETAHITLVGQKRIRPAWESHYENDIRARNSETLDTYQLKSLEGFVEYKTLDRIERVIQDPETKRLLLFFPENKRYTAEQLFREVRPGDIYDIIIRCLGFTFDFGIFRPSTRVHAGKGRHMGKYVAIGHNYEVDRSPGIFVAGAAAHSLDYRRAAGGSIRGYRYTARALWHLLDWRYHSVPWPCRRIRTTDLMKHILKRVNEASGLWHMIFMLADVIIIPQTPDHPDTVEYCEEVPTHLVTELYRHTGRHGNRLLLLTFQISLRFWKVGRDVFLPGRLVTNSSMAANSTSIHPVLYYFKNVTKKPARQHDRWFLKPYPRLPKPTAIHHVLEDFLFKWDQPRTHLMPLRHFLDHALDTDLRMRFSEQCLEEVLTSRRASPYCRDEYFNKQGLTKGQLFQNEKPGKRYVVGKMLVNTDTRFFSSGRVESR